MSRQGTRIGPYALEVQVGRASGCTLWNATRADGKQRGPQKVAVRVLDDPGDNAALARLELEYQQLKALDGAGAPAAVALYSGFGALVMSRLRGVTLRSLIDAALAATLELDQATAIEVALGTARVLRHAHQLTPPIVHGRLGPGDVILSSDSSISLVGWAGWSPRTWSPGVAPELLRGQPSSEQADVWSLGALLAATLRPRITQKQGLPAASRQVARSWPAAGRLLERLLAPDPALRATSLDDTIPELLALARYNGGVARVGELAERCSSFRRGPLRARSLAAAQAPAAPVVPAAPLASKATAPLVVEAAPPAAQAMPAHSVAPGPAQARPVARPEPPTEPAAAGVPAAVPAGEVPLPVAPKPPTVARSRPPAASPAASEDPPAEPVEDELEKTEPLQEPEDSGEAAQLRSDGVPYGEEPSDLDDEQKSRTEMVEQVAVALVGLLLMAILAYLGKACLGG